MFELDREVANWTSAAYADQCRRSDSLAELRDHLYCEIEQGRATGLTDEHAFAAAVAKIGPGVRLAAEHAKNRSWLGRACATLERWDRWDSGGGQRGLLVGHGILWAALTISLALFTRGSSKDFGMWLIVILVPCWLGSEQILRQALKQRPPGASR